MQRGGRLLKPDSEIHFSPSRGKIHSSRRICHGGALRACEGREEEGGRGPPILLSMKRQGILTARNYSHLTQCLHSGVVVYCSASMYVIVYNYFGLCLFPWAPWPPHSGRVYKIFQLDFKLFLSHFRITISRAAAFTFRSCSFGSLRIPRTLWRCRGLI